MELRVASQLSKKLHKTGELKRNQIVLEASADRSLPITEDGQTMGVWIITDKMIKDNHLQEISDPIMFKNGVEPTDQGLFSTTIFGETAKERSKNHAYIDLHRRFFHPYVFEIIRKLIPKNQLDLIVMGQGSWNIDANGTLEQIKEENDSRYNADNTGLGWLIENFRKISIKETDSLQRKERLRLLQNLTDEEMFISKWVVIPILYRDFSIDNGKKSVPEINNMYRDLIMHTNSYENEILSMSKHLTLWKIQKLLIDIRSLGQSLIEKKKGIFQKGVLGKAIDHGGRGVISVPSLSGIDHPNDCIVDITHSGIPLSYCIQMGYPFMIKWVLEFFEDTFRNKSLVPCYEIDKDGNYNVVYEKIDDQSEVFTKKFIDEKMETFSRTYGEERFETVKIRKTDGTWTEMYFPGEAGKPSEKANSIWNRPMTWTDVFYLAAVESLSDKYCYITRYPLEDYFGTFPSQVAVLSTLKTAPAYINGKIYPHYPVIDLSLSANQIATQFIDTFTVSNLYLDAIGGD